MKEHPMHKRQFVVKPLVLAVAALSTVGGQAVLAEEKQRERAGHTHQH